MTAESDADSAKYSARHTPAHHGEAFIADSGCPNPYIIKIDVEGAMFGVLEGLRDLLEEAWVIFCEVHNPKGSDNEATALTPFLETEGSDVYPTEISSPAPTKIQESIQKIRFQYVSDIIS